MAVDDGSGAPEPVAPVRTWPALDIDGLEPPIDELIEAELMDFDVSAIQETSAASRRVFFVSPDHRDAARAALTSAFPALTLASLDVPDDNWAARSQASLTPVLVGRIVVTPPWAIDTARQMAAGSGDHAPGLVLTIQPSMGFGTGHHATTRLCLQALQRATPAHRTVIDVGTGSGVLAIASSLLGASEVVGLDDDADAIQAARENLELNAGARVRLEQSDVRSSNLRPADVVIANLTGGLLVGAAARLAGLVRSGGLLILSGLMTHEEQDVLSAFAGFRLLERSHEDEWVCLTLRAVER